MTEDAVVISGAGPNGLMLAAELAMAGVRPIVLERGTGPSTEPRANGMVGQIVRLLDMRGLYEPVAGRPGPPPPTPGHFFGGLPLGLDDVPGNPLYLLPVPQAALTRMLADRAGELGVPIRWGHELVDLEFDDDRAVVTVQGPDGRYRLRARFMVGADGGHSVVRKKAGIEFPGVTRERGVSRMGHVRLPERWSITDDGLEVPGLGLLRPGFNRVDHGMVTVAQLEPGRPMLAAQEPAGAPVADDVPMSIDELRASLERLLGVECPIGSPDGPGPHALRRIVGQNTRQAQAYRKGPVLLVGDAAHVHSAMGGPGLNLGLADAVNLGWKLAAVVRGDAPAGLLDTYHAERYPAGERVTVHSQAQTALVDPGSEVTALRRVFGELMERPETAGQIAHLLAGSDVRYPVGDEHPWSGYLAPEATLDTAEGPCRLAEFCRSGRPLLVDRTPGGVLAEAARPWQPDPDVPNGTLAASPPPGARQREQVSGAPNGPLAHPDGPSGTLAAAPASAGRLLVVRADGAVVDGAASVPDGWLVRPDGYVAWAGDADGAEALTAALTRWFGAPSAVGDHVLAGHWSVGSA